MIKIHYWPLYVAYETESLFCPKITVLLVSFLAHKYETKTKVKLDFMRC